MEVEYKSSVVRELRKIDPSQVKRIISKLEKILTENPNEGIPLKGEFAGLFKLRIGDYRAIYTKTKNGVLVLRIEHKSKVYG